MSYNATDITPAMFTARRVSEIVLVLSVSVIVGADLRVKVIRVRVGVRVSARVTATRECGVAKCFSR